MAEVVKLHDLEFELMISKEEIRARVSQIGGWISEHYKGQNPVFIAILNGSFIFAADLMRAVTIDCEISFVKLASYIGEKSSGKIDELIGLNTDLKGRTVIIVEDIIDSGNTLTRFVPMLEEMGPNSISIATLLIKPEALEHDIIVDYTAFEIDPKFVVGYGLDYRELGRNLPGIYQKI